MKKIKPLIKTHYMLIIILFFGLLLRLLYFNDITFNYDQARDALEALSIWRNNPVILVGPTSDIPGVTHGILYWYLISPFYFFSGGDPRAVKLFLILINLINVLFIYYFSNKLFNNKKISLLSALLFSVSFDAIQYARWLSNPAPAILSVSVFFYGFWELINKKRLGLPLMFLAWSFSFQFEFFLIYLLGFIFLGLIYSLFINKQIPLLNKKSLMFYFLSLIIISPYIALELKFGFRVTSALSGFFRGNREFNTFDVVRKLGKFWESLVGNIRYNIIDFNIVFPKILLLSLIALTIYYLVKNRKFKKQIAFLFIWFISPIVIYPIERNSSYFLNIGNSYPLLILIAYFLLDLTKKIRFNLKIIAITSTILIIISSNLFLIINNNKNGEMLLSVQDKITLSDEMRIIDWVYQESKGKNFAINTVTNPLFINTTWAYLFDWYGKPKYHYLPIWLGYPQNDVFGKDIKFKDEKMEKMEKNMLFYLIFEPTNGIPEIYVKGFSKYENTRSVLIEKKQFGNFVVEKRLITEYKYFLRDDLMEMSLGKQL